jgi:signal peptidase I
MIPSILNPVLVSLGVFVGIIACGILLARSLFLFVTVRGESMTPTLKPQDHVLVLRKWATRKLKKGAIVLLKNPSEQHLLPSPGTSFIKRIVAMEGDTYIDTDSEMLPESLYEHYTLDETGRRHWHIPSGKVFVCGDNLAASRDSRKWGPVPLSAIQGVVVHQFRRKAQIPIPESPFTLSFLAIGQEAPNFTVSDTHGECVTLQDMRGQRLLLLFTAYHRLAHTMLPPLLTQATNVSSKGITVLIICDGSLERARLLQKDFAITFPVLVAPQSQISLYKDYQIHGTPCYYLIDEEGQVAEAGIANAHSWQWD